jgi:HAD superfamily hydrolase (TIGR01548 family)
MIAVVSPNNPTGAVASASDLKRLAAAAPGAILLVDVAYAEFADEDLTAAAIEIPNAIAIRTFSKAFGLAGLRVGYAMGAASNMGAVRASGSPFPVSAVSLAAAAEALRMESAVLPSVVARVRDERAALFKLLGSLGSTPLPSQGNFVLAEFADAEWVWRSLGSLGIGIRRFKPGPGLDRSLRITCPGKASSFDRLCKSLRSALRPQGLLFDMDGVLADVSGSYRRAIVLTAESFGVRLSPREIDAGKAEGNANNDWVLTHRLLSRRGVSASLSEVTARFESFYHGGDGTPGLSASERLIPGRALLERLAARLPLAIVTGRPRADCDCFLDRFGLRDLFRAVVCMEDAPLKPDPAPVRLALEQLGISAAWMIGDTPDDANAARSAGVVPIGIPPPALAPDGAAREALMRAGAARVLDSLNDLETLLP